MSRGRRMGAVDDVRALGRDRPQPFGDGGYEPSGTDIWPQKVRFRRRREPGQAQHAGNALLGGGRSEDTCADHVHSGGDLGQQRLVSDRKRILGRDDGRDDALIREVLHVLERPLNASAT